VSYVSAAESGSIHPTSRKRRLALGNTGAPVQTLENLEMKKTLVALAALAATSAFAQSTVTMYGAVDAGYAKTTQDAGATTTRKATIGGGSSYTSRLGLTATEDLGAGQKAGFTYEMALGSLGGDTANNTAFSSSNASGLRTGQVFVSDAKLGTVTAGYGMTARHVQAATLDMTGGFNAAGNLMTAVGVGGFGTTSGSTAGAYTNMDYSLRANAVSWTSPTYNGFTGVYGHIFSDSTVTTDATDAKTTNANARANLIGLNYAQGPLTLMGSLTRTTTDATAAVAAVTGAGCALSATTGLITCTTNPVTAVAANATVKNNNIIGGIYDFGIAKVSVGTYADKLQNINTTGDAANDVLNKGTQVGVRGAVPGTKLELVGQMGKGTYVKGGVDKENRKTSGATFGAIYNFSKRTSAYGIYGQQTRAQDASSSTAFNALNDKIVALGLRHNF
jgi:predicted porin